MITDREPVQINEDFIMEEIIIFNECMGVNGRIAYLYRSRETGLWTAYGYSAYKTSEMAREKGLRTVEGFSKRVQMPATVLDMETFEYITSQCFSEEQDADCTRLLLPDTAPVDWDGYRDWAQRLK